MFPAHRASRSRLTYAPQLQFKVKITWATTFWWAALTWPQLLMDTYVGFFFYHASWTECSTPSMLLTSGTRRLQALALFISRSISVLLEANRWQSKPLTCWRSLGRVASERLCKCEKKIRNGFTRWKRSEKHTLLNVQEKLHIFSPRGLSLLWSTTHSLSLSSFRSRLRINSTSACPLVSFVAIWPP